MIDISIIIATLGKNQNIQSVIKSVNQSNGIMNLRYEIIVVSSLRNNFINDPNAKLIVKPLFNQLSQKNLGVELSKGNYLLFLDDDNLLHPSAINLFWKNRDLADRLCGKILSPLNLIEKKSSQLSKIKNFIFYRRNTLPFKLGSLLIPNNFGNYLKSPFAVEYTPGGFTFMKKDKFFFMKLQNYQGKAYFEDALVSLVAKKKKQNLFCIPDAILFEPFPGSAEIKSIEELKDIIFKYKNMMFNFSCYKLKKVKFLFGAFYYILSYLRNKL